MWTVLSTLLLLSWKKMKAMVLEKMVAAHQYGNGYKTISKQFGVQCSTVKEIIHKRKTFKTVVNLPKIGHPSKSTQESDCMMLRKIQMKSKSYISDLTGITEHVKC